MKKEDREENMQIMFKKYMEHIHLCSVHIFEHDSHIDIHNIFFGYMCNETE